MTDPFGSLPPDEQRLILQRLADMIDEYQQDKRRLEFERKLFHSHPPVKQEGFCLS